MGRNKKGKKKVASMNDEDSGPVKSAPTVEDDRRFEQELELALRISKEEELKKRQDDSKVQGDTREKKATVNGPMGKWNMDSPDIPVDNESNGSADDDFEEVSRKGKKSKRRGQMEDDGGPMEVWSNNEVEEMYNFSRYSIPLAQKQPQAKKNSPVAYQNGSIGDNLSLVPPLTDVTKSYVTLENAKQQIPRRELKLADFIPETTVKPPSIPKVDPVPMQPPSTPLNYSTLVSQLKPTQPQQINKQPPTSQPNPRISPPQNYPILQQQQQRPVMQTPTIQPQYQNQRAKVNTIYSPSFNTFLPPSEPLEVDKTPLDPKQRVITPPITPPISRSQSPPNHYSLFTMSNFNHLTNAFNSTLLLPEDDFEEEEDEDEFYAAGPIQTSRLHQYKPSNGLHDMMDNSPFHDPFSAFSARPITQEISWNNPRKTVSAPYQPTMNAVHKMTQKPNALVDDEHDPEVARLMKYLLAS